MYVLHFLLRAMSGFMQEGWVGKRYCDRLAAANVMDRYQRGQTVDSEIGRAVDA